MNQKIKFQDYELAHTGRIAEDIEWSDRRHYNAKDKTSPRVLLIGDSICSSYQNMVRENLKSCINVSYWISSRCVTDPLYLRELDFTLDCGPYSMITFNNGLHSIVTNQTEWAEAYDNIVRFMIAKLPETKLSLVLSTPLKDAYKTSVSNQLNRIVLKIAEKYHLPVLDLFSPMDPLDREEFWDDCYHFKEPGCRQLANMVSDFVLKNLNMNNAGTLIQKSTETGPDGKLK